MLIAASLCRCVGETPSAQCCEQSLSVWIGTRQLNVKCVLLTNCREVVVSHRNISETEHSVIIYSPMCRSKTVCVFFFLFTNKSYFFHAVAVHGSQTVKLLK